MAQFVATILCQELIQSCFELSNETISELQKKTGHDPIADQLFRFLNRSGDGGSRTHRPVVEVLYQAEGFHHTGGRLSRSRLELIVHRKKKIIERNVKPLKKT